MFQISGSDINVPPPTINHDNNNLSPLGPGEQDDGQYREDPSIYYKDEKYNNPPAAKQQYNRPAPAIKQQPQQNYQQQSYQSNFIPEQQQQQYQQNYVAPQPKYRQSFQHQPQQQQQYQQYQQPANLFHGHPADNFDINTGSYSLSYTG